MASNKKTTVPIDYTHRDYESIRKDLMGVAERLYPNTFQDFSEASFGSLMIDAVAYVGDQLSFYCDYNVNESFLNTAFEYDNVLRTGKALGYKYTGRPSTYGQVALYVMIPASATGLGPDSKYVPLLKRGSKFTSTTGLNFVLTENVDFGDPQNPVVVAMNDPGTGAPSQFAIKAYGNVVSGYFGREEITIGAYEAFKKVTIADPNVSEIISVVDSEGNEYFEVDYLAQDVIYKEVANNNYKNDNVPSVMKPYVVARKFLLDQDQNSATLQFGSGDCGSSNVVADPGSVAANVFGKDYVTDTTFDPTRLHQNELLGIVPQNTTLTVSYRATNPANSSVSTGQLSFVQSALVDFENADTLVTTTINNVISSLEVSNELPITGDTSAPTTAELKQRITDTFPTQNRAVTQKDYENLAYRMASQFGAVSRVSCQRDASSSKRNLNMYVISEDKFGKLITTNSTIKNNLKTWLNEYRMINDTVDILDAYIINLGIEFVMKPASGADKYSLLDAAMSALSSHFSTKFYIGEALLISDIYTALNGVTGILDVSNVKITNKTGATYASTEFDIDSNISPDGSYLIAPANTVFEIKYPSVDIIGKIV